MKQRSSDLRFFLAALLTFPICIIHIAIARNEWKAILSTYPDEWFGGSESLMIANVMLTFQTPSGGWLNDIDYQRVYKDPISDLEMEKYRYSDEPTFEDGATTHEIRYLARIFAKKRHPELLKAMTDAFRFILDAQYATGGWPTKPGQSDADQRLISFRDKHQLYLLKLLQDVMEGGVDSLLSFLDEATKQKIQHGWERGLNCILNSQVSAGGTLTIWSPYYNSRTLQPSVSKGIDVIPSCASLATEESVEIIEFLMTISSPSQRITRSVKAAIEWLSTHQLKQRRVEYFKTLSGINDIRLVFDPVAEDLWASFYQIDTGMPLFIEDDGAFKDFESLSYKQRHRIKWYTISPRRALHAAIFLALALY